MKYKIFHGFLWLPKIINGKTKWLQHALWDEWTIEEFEKLTSTDIACIIRL